MYLSAPEATDTDIEAVVAAMKSGWIAPVGPSIQAFESDMCALLGVRHAVALSSGTAALHLALKFFGVGQGDCVIVPTVTFGATAFPVSYVGATPVFVDVEETSWNLDPDLTTSAIKDLEASGRRVAAIIPVDLYGTPAQYTELQALALAHGIPLISDAAEALGASYEGRPAGSLGDAAVLSFNGNKIITTSGGGMLVTSNQTLAEKVRYWSTQAREPLPWYEHLDIGYNYRLSNLLAALGQSQLSRLGELVAKRRLVRSWYAEGLNHLAGVSVQADVPWGESNAWLTVATFDGDLHPNAAERVRLALEEQNIESRPVWKPLHMQPVFTDAPSYLSGVAERLFAEGLCLPSGPHLTQEQVMSICELIEECLAA